MRYPVWTPESFDSPPWSPGQAQNFFRRPVFTRLLMRPRRFDEGGGVDGACLARGRDHDSGARLSCSMSATANGQTPAGAPGALPAGDHRL
jgi:hypothetical protein